MSSRLWARIRAGMGAAYYVRAFNDPYTDHGIFQASAGVDNKRVKQIVAAIIDEMRKLKMESVSKDDLRRAKDSLIGRLYLNLETSDQLADFYGFQEVLKHDIKSAKEIVSKIERVRAADVKRVAKKIFVTKNLNLAIIGPSTSKASFAKMLRL